MKTRIVVFFLSIFLLTSVSSLNASYKSNENIETYLFNKEEPAQIVDYMYPCLFEWQVPPLCR